MPDEDQVQARARSQLGTIRLSMAPPVYFDAIHYLQIPILKRDSWVDILESNVPRDDTFLED